MIITLDVFSGRTNPSWKLSEKDAKSFLERFTNKSVTTTTHVDNVLGYRGIIVSATSDNQLPEALPPEFRVGGITTGDPGVQESNYTALTAEEADDAVNWLL